MPIFEVTDMKPEKQAQTLKAVCLAISRLEDDQLEGLSEELLTAMMDCMDEQDQNDGWGTEGWQHYLGFE